MEEKNKYQHYYETVFENPSAHKITWVTPIGRISKVTNGPKPWMFLLRYKKYPRICKCFESNEDAEDYRLNWAMKDPMDRHQYGIFEYGSSILCRARSGLRWWMDDCDRDLLERIWCRHTSGYITARTKTKALYIHRIILERIDSSQKNLNCDHINGIVYDNRRSNLRWVTQRENVNNIRRGDRSGSGRRGVTHAHADFQFVAAFKFSKIGFNYNRADFKSASDAWDKAVQQRCTWETQCDLYHPNSNDYNKVVPLNREWWEKKQAKAATNRINRNLRQMKKRSANRDVYNARQRELRAKRKKRTGVTEVKSTKS